MTKTEVEVITSAEPRRSWSAEEKRRIVAAATSLARWYRRWRGGWDS